MASRLLLLTAVGAFAVSAAPAAAQVTNGNQIFNGSVCVGLSCGTDVNALGLTMNVKTGDTPGTRYEQVAGDDFAAQTWDVAGNEANFFVRDVTGGSRLPFRVRPGAPTSALDLQADGSVRAVGVLEQTMAGASSGTAEPATGLLAQLRTLGFKRYSGSGLTHIAPEPTTFASVFGVGTSDRVAPADVASVALAAVKELDARVSALELTPGPKGDTGAGGSAGAKGETGARGSDGAVGARGSDGAAGARGSDGAVGARGINGAVGARGSDGAAGTNAAAADLTAAQARIARLERDNKKLSKSLASLRKQVIRLAKKR